MFVCCEHDGGGKAETPILKMRAREREKNEGRRERERERERESSGPRNWKSRAPSEMPSRMYASADGSCTYSGAMHNIV